MNKKLIKILLFIFALMLIIFIHAEYSKGNVEAGTIINFLPYCGIMGGYSNLSCTLEGIVDDDGDGNVSLNVTIFNNFDYSLTDVSLIFEYESYVKHEKIVESKSGLNVETPDFYSYLDRVDSSRFPTSFKFTYTDVSGEKKELEGQFHSPIFKTREAYEDMLRQKQERELGQEKESEELKKHQHEIQTKFILFGGIIFICFIMWQLRKKRNFDFKNLITATVSSFFLSIILAGFVYTRFIYLLLPIKYYDVQSYNAYLIPIFMDTYVFIFVFLASFISIALWLYKNSFTNKMIIKKALLFLAVESFILAIISFLSNYVVHMVRDYRTEKHYILFGLILGIITFAIGKFLLKNDRLGKEIEK